MFVIHKTLIISVLTSLVFCQDIDPDLELCADLTIDAASLGDDNHNYAFKGQHFWTFDSKRGFTKAFARHISERWIGLPTPIDASFSIDDQNYRLSMIFIVNQRWYLYKQRYQLTNGLTADWPLFPSGIIDTAMSLFIQRTFSKNQIIFFHDNSSKYSRYVFKSVDKPTHNITDKSDISVTSEKVFIPYLFDESELNQPPYQRSSYVPYMNSLTNWMPLTAGMINYDHMFLFGKRKYCRDGLPGYCTRETPEKFFNCPRLPRPSLRPITTVSVNAEPGDGSANQNSKSTGPPKNNKPNVVIWVLLIVIVFVLCVVGISIVSVILSNCLVNKNYDKYKNVPKGVESVPKTRVNKETVQVIDDSPVVVEKTINSDTTEEVEADQILDKLKSEPTIE